MELGNKIGTYRGAVLKLVWEREGTGTAEPLEYVKQYDVGNATKSAKTGEWQPLGRDKDVDECEDGFAEPDLSPIQFPVFKEAGE